jgi:crotonobetainyl-CoA:carnitine CoA-transferase CaiB-like acyl-CoA transferase
VASERDIRGDVAALAELVPGPPLPVDRLRIGGTATLASAFDVDRLALASVAASNLAAAVTEVHRDLVVAGFVGHLEIDGTTPPVWADLSGYYRTADGRFLQFHCNFPHHAAGVVARLRCEPTRESVQAAVLEWDPLELEAALVADGMIAAYLRTMDEWSAHPHAAATAALPVVSVEQVDDAPPREPGRRPRVLDCSRVLAGPVAGQALGAHGADVLRVGAAHLPSIEPAVIVTGSGKRNAFVDLDTADGRAGFDRLLSGADVWIDAYRPGAFAEHGFDATGYAGLVTVQLCAFDWTGPWAGRRGFDSIVQSTTGIVEAGRAASGSDEPTPLPVQALDYATGYLAAFAASRLIAHQAEVGGTWLARVSLLRTRNWLVSLGGPHPFEPARPTVPPHALQQVESDFGLLTMPWPVGGSWAHPPRRLGSSPPEWAP